jgi:UDP-glucuronate 4-epimerase
MSVKKRIFVTGAGGFIGSHLTEALLNRGDEVIGMDNFDPFYPERIKRRNIKNIIANPGFKFYEVSILDFEKLTKVFQDNKITHVVHLAAKAGVRPSITKPLLYQKTNVEGTGNVLQVMRNFNVNKFIFASSSSVYGNNKKVPFRESDNVDNPISPYAATKKAGELICFTYHHLFDLDIYALRFFTVYGPRQRPEMAIHKFTRAIDSGIPIQVYGHGKPKRDYTYIDDIIQGVLRSIDRVKGFEIINLGESQTIVTNYLISEIEKLLGKKAVRQDLPMQPGDVIQTYADVDKAKKILDYKPEISISTGLKEFIDWYRSEKEFLENV